METKSVWLIYHKASLNQYSPMNLDGSEYMVGVGVVPAGTMKESLKVFDEYLDDQKMSIIDLWKCEKYRKDQHQDQSQDNREISELTLQALENDNVYYACGISSEALDCIEDN